MTWTEIAEMRGYQNQGNGTWLAPNGQVVSEGFVAAYCDPVRTAIDVVMANLTTECAANVLPTDVPADL